MTNKTIDDNEKKPTIGTKSKSKVKKDSDIEWNPKLEGMIIPEENLSEAELSMAQRRKRAIVFRKNKAKIAIGRKRASKKKATGDVIVKRARKKAIAIVKKKLASNKDTPYGDLSVGQKNVIDKKLISRKGLINKLTRKMIPKIRALERERMSSRGSTSTPTPKSESYVPVPCPPKKFHMALNSDNTVKHDMRFKRNKKGNALMKIDETSDLFEAIDAIFEHNSSENGDNSNQRKTFSQFVAEMRLRDPADEDDDYVGDGKDSSKHFVMQLRKAISLKGARPVEFADGKSVKINPNEADKFLDMYADLKPAEKEKLQSVASRSYKAFQAVIKRG